MRILLVDDEEELVSALAERLAIRGFEADFALTGRQALALARKSPFDIAILDVKMPGVSGLALMRKLQEIRPETRYIFLTGHGSENDYRECAEAGVCSYIMKPVRIEDLIARIHDAADRGKGR
jgi:DNA-binding response OmpR family regulator